MPVKAPKLPVVKPLGYAAVQAGGRPSAGAAPLEATATAGQALSWDLEEASPTPAGLSEPTAVLSEEGEEPEETGAGWHEPGVALVSHSKAQVQLLDVWTQVERRKQTRAKDGTQEALNQMWQAFKGNKADVPLRDRLALHYMHLVRSVVSRLPLNLPSSLCVEDLISYGTIGLLESIQRFDPDRGLKFETYASLRIRGEIIDQLRSQDWVPRGVRKRSKQLMEALTHLEQTLGRTPTEEELSGHLGITKQRLQALQNETSHLVLSLDEHINADSDGSSLSLLDTVADKNGLDPLGRYEEGDLKHKLAGAIHSLPEREKLLIALYYQENLTLKEIGDIISVSESRVCQLHAQALMRLKTRMAQHV